jgi:hypothetical protein
VVVIANFAKFVIQIFRVLMALALQRVARIVTGDVKESMMDVGGNAPRLVPWDVAVIPVGVAPTTIP